MTEALSEPVSSSGSRGCNLLGSGDHRKAGRDHAHKTLSTACETEMVIPFDVIVTLLGTPSSIPGPVLGEWAKAEKQVGRNPSPLGAVKPPAPACSPKSKRARLTSPWTRPRECPRCISDLTCPKCDSSSPPSPPAPPPQCRMARTLVLPQLPLFSPIPHPSSSRSCGCIMGMFQNVTASYHCHYPLRLGLL